MTSDTNRHTTHKKHSKTIIDARGNILGNATASNNQATTVASGEAPHGGSSRNNNGNNSIQQLLAILQRATECNGRGGRDIDVFGFLLDRRQFIIFMVACLIMFGFQFCKDDCCLGVLYKVFLRDSLYTLYIFRSLFPLHRYNCHSIACFLLLAMLLHRIYQQWADQRSSSRSISSNLQRGRGGGGGGTPPPTTTWGNRGVRGISDLPCDPVVG